VKLLCQAMMGRVLVLKYLLSGTRERLQLRPVMSDIKLCYFLSTGLQWRFPGIGKPAGVTTGRPGACRARLRGGATTGRQMAKSCLPMAIKMGEGIGMDRARVLFFLGW
jgi:hypothetical protein